MRIAKATLYSRWAWSTVLAAAVFAVLALLDMQLRALSGVGTTDLQGFATASQYRAAFWAWTQQSYAMRAGFDLGFDFLLMPLYAAAFFYSGVIAAEAFAPKPGRLRRIILMAAMVPPVGALCDVAENSLQLTMMLNGPSDFLAGIASEVSTAKYVALVIGLVLLAGALFARFDARRKAKAA